MSDQRRIELLKRKAELTRKPEDIQAYEAARGAVAQPLTQGQQAGLNVADAMFGVMESPVGRFALGQTAFIDNAVNSATLGNSENIQAAANMALDRIVGKKTSFNDARDTARQTRQFLRNEAPGASLAGEVAGYIAPGSAGLKLGSNVTRAVGSKVIPASVKRLANPAGTSLGARLTRYGTGVLAPASAAGMADFGVYQSTVGASNRAAAENRDVGLAERGKMFVEGATDPLAVLAGPAASSLYRTGRGAVTAGQNTIKASRQASRIKPVAGSLTPNSRAAQVQAQLAATSGSQTPRQKALKMISKRLDQQGMTTDDLRAAIKNYSYGGYTSVDEMLFELAGASNDQLAVAIASIGGDAKHTAIKKLTNRSTESPARVRRELRRAMGLQGDDFYDLRDELRNRRLTEPKPLYDAAYGKEVTDEAWQNEILPVFKTSPSAREALDDAIRYAGDTNEPAVMGQLDQFRRALDSETEAPQKLSTQALDFVDRMLGDKAQGIRQSSGRRELARGPQSAQSTIRSTLDPQTGLNEPRNLVAELKSAEEALEFGRKAFKQNTDLETLVNEFDDVARRYGANGAQSEDIRGSLLLGWLRGAEDEVATATNPGSVIRKIYGNERQRQKLLEMLPEKTDDMTTGKKADLTKKNRALLGDEASGRVGRIDREKEFLANQNRLIGNSQTAPRTEAIAEQGANQDRVRRLAEALLGPQEAAKRLLVSGVNRLARPGIYNPDVNRELGDLLFTSGAQPLRNIADELDNLRPPKPPGGPPPNAPLIAAARNVANGPPKQSGFAPELVGTTAGGTIGIDLDGDGNISYQERLAGAGAGLAGTRVARGASNRVEELAYGQKLTPARAQQLADEGFDTSKTYYHGSPNRTISGDFKQSAADGVYGEGVYLTDSKNYARKYKMPDRVQRKGVRVAGQDLPFPLDPRMITKDVNGKLYEASIRGKGIDTFEVYRRVEAEWKNGLRPSQKGLTREEAQRVVTQQLRDEGYTHEIIPLKQGGNIIRVFDPKDVAGHNTLAKPDVKQFGGDAPRQNPPSRKQRIGSTAGDVVALGSLAALGAPPAEGETTDFSADIAATSDRITQLESQIIPSIESDLTILEGDGSPESIKQIQQLMNMRLGSNLKVDGALGTETSKAIQNYRANVQAQLETAQGELEQARQRRSQLEFRQSQQDAATSNAMLAKAGPLAGFVGGAALAYLNRRRGVGASKTNAANVEKSVNSLISTAPIKAPTRSTNALAQRAANVNEVWRQGGAGENVPFKQLQSGEWRPRPNAVEPANLYPQKNTLYTTTDLGVAGTGFAEAALIQPLKIETQNKIDQLRADRERYEAAGDVAGYDRTMTELAAAEDFYSTLVTMERLGIGLGATALGAPLKMRNASPKPNIAGAETDAALVRGAIEKRRQSVKK